MDPWSPAYHDPAGASRRYNGGGSGSSSSSSQLRDNNGDVAMADANDSYASMKYPMRPHHGSRQSTLHSPPEQSAAAQRYSPMEVMSPTSPYAKSGQFTTPSGSRQSPSRPSDYQSPQSPYYQNSRTSSAQLPTMASLPAGVESHYQFGNVLSPVAAGRNDGWQQHDPTSPRRITNMTAGPVVHKGPVPEFRKLRTAQDLRPKVNAQPAFRRANPEGGFISVCVLYSSGHMS